MSATMENFCTEVLPHMVLDGETHTHDLDETMYGGTLTVQDKEVSYGEVVFGKPDVFLLHYLICFLCLVMMGKVTCLQML